MSMRLDDRYGQLRYVPAPAQGEQPTPATPEALARHLEHDHGVPPKEIRDSGLSPEAWHEGMHSEKNDNDLEQGHWHFPGTIWDEHKPSFEYVADIRDSDLKYYIPHCACGWKSNIRSEAAAAGAWSRHVITLDEGGRKQRAGPPTDRSQLPVPKRHAKTGMAVDPTWWDKNKPRWLYHKSEPSNLPGITQDGLVPQGGGSEWNNEYEEIRLQTRPNHVYFHTRPVPRYHDREFARVVVDPDKLNPQKFKADEDWAERDYADSHHSEFAKDPPPTEEHWENAMAQPDSDDFVVPENLGAWGERVNLGDTVEHTHRSITEHHTVAHEGDVPLSAIAGYHQEHEGVMKWHPNPLYEGKQYSPKAEGGRCHCGDRLWPRPIDKASAAVDDSALDQLHTEGGFTVHDETGERAKGPGYLVSVKGHQEAFDPKDLTAATMEHYRVRHGVALGSALWGGWDNRKIDGKLYLDVSEHHPDFQSALTAANKHYQRTFFRLPHTNGKDDRGGYESALTASDQDVDVLDGTRMQGDPVVGLATRRSAAGPIGQHLTLLPTQSGTQALAAWDKCLTGPCQGGPAPRAQSRRSSPRPATATDPTTSANAGGPARNHDARTHAELPPRSSPWGALSSEAPNGHTPPGRTNESQSSRAGWYHTKSIPIKSAALPVNEYSKLTAARIHYHVAPRSKRDQIQAQGLRPMGAGYTQWDESSPEHVHLWDNKDAAHDWADWSSEQGLEDYGKTNEDDPDWDVWEVNTSGLKLKRDTELSTGHTGAWKHEGAISGDRLKLSGPAGWERQGAWLDQVTAPYQQDAVKEPKQDIEPVLPPIYEGTGDPEDWRKITVHPVDIFSMPKTGMLYVRDGGSDTFHIWDEAEGRTLECGHPMPEEGSGYDIWVDKPDEGKICHQCFNTHLEEGIEEMHRERQKMIDDSKREFPKSAQATHHCDNDFCSGDDRYIGKDRIPPSQAEGFEKLRQRILGDGEHLVVPPGGEEDLSKIVERGQNWDGHDATLMKGLPINCHGNAAELHTLGYGDIATGYACSENGYWRPHSWAVGDDNKPIETTVPRVKYHGVILNQDEADTFVAHNSDRDSYPGLQRKAQVERKCVLCKNVFSESKHGEATGFCGNCREKEGLVDHHSWSEDAQKGHYGSTYDRSGVRTNAHPDFLFHVTHPRHRESIQQLGLDGTRFGESEPNPAGNYFREPDTEYFQQDLRYPGHDIWKVDVRGIPLEADSSDNDHSWFSKEVVPPERLELMRPGHYGSSGCQNTCSCKDTGVPCECTDCVCHQKMSGARVMYHVTDPKYRDSILQHGVDYTRGESHLDEFEGAEPGNYLYADDPDLWKVDVKDLPLDLDPYDDDAAEHPTAYYTPDPIPKHRVELVRRGKPHEALAGYDARWKTAMALTPEGDLPDKLRDTINEFRKLPNVHRLSDPDEAHDRCGPASKDFANFAESRGHNAEVRKLRQDPWKPGWGQNSQSEHDNYIGYRHSVPFVDGHYVDWTARQYAPDSPVPRIYKNLKAGDAVVPEKSSDPEIGNHPFTHYYRDKGERQFRMNPPSEGGWYRGEEQIRFAPGATEWDKKYRPERRDTDCTEHNPPCEACAKGVSVWSHECTDRCYEFPEGHIPARECKCEYPDFDPVDRPSPECPIHNGEGPVKAWFAKNQKTGAQTRTKRLQAAAVLDRRIGRPDASEVLHTFDDGWSVRRIHKAGDVWREGKLMSNCWRNYLPADIKSPANNKDQREVVEGFGKDHDLPHDYDYHYSLRDADNLPRASFFHHQAGEHADLRDDECIPGDRPEVGSTGMVLGAHGSEPKPDYLDRLSAWHDALPYDVVTDFATREPRVASIMSSVDDIPPRPGTAPIPEGHVRIYHATWADPEVLKREGLSMQKARESYERGGTEFPAIFGYAGHHPALEAHESGGGANVVEFHLHPDDLDIGRNRTPEDLEARRSTVTTMKDVPPENIVAVHEPWHAQYHMIKDDPRIEEAVMAGEHDWAMDDDRMKPLGDAIRRVKRENHKLGSTHRPLSPLDYKEPGVERISIEDPDFPGDPNHPYFKEPGTVAFLDHTPHGNDVFINYAATHRSQQGQGHAATLLHRLYDQYPGTVEWGRIMDPPMGKLYERFKADPELGPRTHGHNPFKEASRGMADTAQYAGDDYIIRRNGLDPYAPHLDFLPWTRVDSHWVIPDGPDHDFREALNHPEGTTLHEDAPLAQRVEDHFKQHGISVDDVADRFEHVVRTADPWVVNYGKGWYQHEAGHAADRLVSGGYTRHTAAHIIADLSPQNNWLGTANHPELGNREEAVRYGTEVTNMRQGLGKYKDHVLHVSDNDAEWAHSHFLNKDGQSTATLQPGHYSISGHPSQWDIKPEQLAELPVFHSRVGRRERTHAIKTALGVRHADEFGAKTAAFGHNIDHPLTCTRVTVDTHMADASGAQLTKAAKAKFLAAKGGVRNEGAALGPYGGTTGGYGMAGIASATLEATRKLNAKPEKAWGGNEPDLLPHQVQAIVWTNHLMGKSRPFREHIETLKTLPWEHVFGYNFERPQAA